MNELALYLLPIHPLKRNGYGKHWPRQYKHRPNSCLVDAVHNASNQHHS
jgi:hypothetical protein